MEKLGIDLNDAANGVALPTSFHQKMHTNDYYRMLNEAAGQWKTPDQARQGLRAIAERLKNEAAPVAPGVKETKK